MSIIYHGILTLNNNSYKVKMMADARNSYRACWTDRGTMPTHHTPLLFGDHAITIFPDQAVGADNAAATALHAALGVKIYCGHILSTFWSN